MKIDSHFKNYAICIQVLFNGQILYLCGKATLPEYSVMFSMALFFRYFIS